MNCRTDIIATEYRYVTTSKISGRIEFKITSKDPKYNKKIEVATNE